MFRIISKVNTIYWSWRREMKEEEDKKFMNQLSCVFFPFPQQASKCCKPCKQTQEEIIEVWWKVLHTNFKLLRSKRKVEWKNMFTDFALKSFSHDVNAFFLTCLWIIQFKSLWKHFFFQSNFDFVKFDFPISSFRCKKC